MTAPPPAGAGPLAGVRIVELAGIGPGPFAAMVLADLGAEVLRVDRVTEVRPERFGTPHPDLLNRGRRSLAADLKTPEGRQVVLDLVRSADVLIEGFRPGVTERLGLGPDDCLALNPRLVYGRMTGWGQDGPNAGNAGHDIDYLALTGVLHGIGRPGERPVPPMNLVGDFGGGGMLLALGVVCALFAVRGGGTGQVVDAAMVDGVSLLATMIHSLRGMGLWGDERGRNIFDGGAPFYDTYECADGRHLAVGAVEPRFYAELVRLTGFPLPPDEALDRTDPTNWPALHRAWARLFRTRTRDEWAALLEHTDACVVPVLDWREAPRHPHLAAREVFVDHAGAEQPAPAPRFSRTPGAIRRPPPQPGEHTDELLAELGLDAAQISELRETGAVA
ncbi:CaiB/BaiF CoA-transferase family protein [Micromonospora sp. WMMD1102]|uniref:CaiB/BaiF CoA transferase family protein n=1 Tax=Micromonospora sp. WMMD1102 TaxID=3016105 RepID=UPI002414EC0F|nr:CaiB/BaiF CoA-transferase family protein [Micromonospora sp. WMMD1102]MDG4787380.1 CaiB/BaiF CoA-transferase family protein [Micromonospora sp. WMMD1102]